MNLEAVLERNLGQRLTPELAAGIVAALAPRPLDLSVIEPGAAGEYVFAAERLANLRHDPHWTAAAAEAPVPLDLDAAQDFERFGRYLLFTLRKGGALVGSAGIFLCGTYAHEDLLYVAPAHRRGWLVAQFIHYGEQIVQQHFGITEFRGTSTIDSRALKLWQLLGYQPVAYKLVKKV